MKCTLVLSDTFDYSKLLSLHTQSWQWLPVHNMGYTSRQSSAEARPFFSEHPVAIQTLL